MKKQINGSSNGFVGAIKKYFGIDDNQTSIKGEVIGGLVTFLSMAYILIVNPNMISDQGGTNFGAYDISFNIVFTATAISAAASTLLMGLYARLPIALAPGMGLNAFFVFNLGYFGMGFTYYEALAIVLVSGILFLGITLTGIRTHMINAIPKSLKLSMGAGIGLFIAFVGLSEAHIITQGNGTPLSIGDFTQPTVILAAFGIVLAIILHVKKVTGSILISMVVTAVVGAIFNGIVYSGDHTWLNFGQAIADGEVVDTVDWVASLPKFDWSSGFGLDFPGVAKIPGQVFSGLGDAFSKDFGKALAAIMIFLFVDFFDTAGTIVAVANEAGLVDEDGNLENTDKALFSDAAGTVAGALIGTSTVTAFVESGTGVAAGAKTGLASVVTGLCFILAMFIFPLILPLFTGQVTALAMVMVGILMFAQIKLIDWEDFAIVSASFFMVTLMPLTYAIYWGIVTAFIVYAVVMLVQRREKEVSIPMWVLSGLSVLFFILEFKAI